MAIHNHKLKQEVLVKHPTSETVMIFSLRNTPSSNGPRGSNKRKPTHPPS